MLKKIIYLTRLFIKYIIILKLLKINILNNMKINLKTLITTTLLLLMVFLGSSCKKNRTKVKVDTQFALALFSDTVSLREIINDMDSTTKTWLRVRNDSIFVYYVDTIKGVLNASDLLSNIEDVHFNTNTDFAMPPFYSTGSYDTVVTVDKFMTLPFHYDGYNIKEVLLRSGELGLDFNITPQIEYMRRMEIYSAQMLTSAGDSLKIIIDLNEKTPQVIDLANYRVLPTDDTVTFGARISLNFEEDIYSGGDYTSNLSGYLKDVMFKTIYGTIEQPIDSVFQDCAEIDFGINGLTGSALLPIPIINIAYRNTFGLNAQCNIAKLEFVNTSTGLATNLLDSDVVDVSVYPTEGAWQKTMVQGLTEEVDALAGYTRLDFAGELAMHLNDQLLSISDTSTIDVAADIEMPFAFKLSDLCYNDTIAVNLSGDGNDNSIDDYIDEIDFYIDYNSKIKIDVNMQALFMKDNVVVDSLFLEENALNYSPTEEISTISVIVTDSRLQNVLSADNIVLRLCASTEAISPQSVQMMNSDAIFLRIRILTKSSEIEFGDAN